MKGDTVMPLVTLKTYHGTILRFCIKTQTLNHTHNDNDLPVYLDRIRSESAREGALYVLINKIKFYLKDITADSYCELSTQKECTYSVHIEGDRLSILTRLGFVSANPDGNFEFRQWNKNWEKLSVEDINFPLPDKIINLYYWKRAFEGNKYNVGDLLSKYIVEKITGRQVQYKSISNNSFVAIGSMINNSTLSHHANFWGTGVMDQYVNYVPGNKFYAVRGPLTRHTLISAGYDCPDIFGDPALLLPEFYNPPKRKKYKLGLICHWRHRGILNFSEETIFIDILRKESEVLNFIDEINQCEYIISSSLHGIIVANAYGIPAKWFTVDSRPLEKDSCKKFFDYFSSVQLPMQTPLLLKKGDHLSFSLISNLSKIVDLRLNLSILKDAFPLNLFYKLKNFY